MKTVAPASRGLQVSSHLFYGLQIGTLVSLSNTRKLSATLSLSSLMGYLSKVDRMH
jgi:hypothetical protein